jgi:hypothetical protein
MKNAIAKNAQFMVALAGACFLFQSAAWAQQQTTAPANAPADAEHSSSAAVPSSSGHNNATNGASGWSAGHGDFGGAGNSASPGQGGFGPASSSSWTPGAGSFGSNVQPGGVWRAGSAPGATGGTMSAPSPANSAFSFHPPKSFVAATPAHSIATARSRAASPFSQRHSMSAGSGRGGPKSGVHVRPRTRAPSSGGGSKSKSMGGFGSETSGSTGVGSNSSPEIP